MRELNPLVILNGQIGVLQRRYPVLRRLDDAQWKTWAWHSINTIALGHLIGLLPRITAHGGIHLVLLLYLAREVSQAWRNGRATYDNALDVGIPFVVSEIWLRVVGRGM